MARDKLDFAVSHVMSEIRKLRRTTGRVERKNARVRTFGALKQIENAIDALYPLLNERTPLSNDIADMAERMTWQGFRTKLTEMKLWPDEIDTSRACALVTAMLEPITGESYVVTVRRAVGLKVERGQHTVGFDPDSNLITVTIAVNGEGSVFWRALCTWLATRPEVLVQGWSDANKTNPIQLGNALARQQAMERVASRVKDRGRCRALARVLDTLYEIPAGGGADDDEMDEPEPGHPDGMTRREYDALERWATSEDTIRETIEERGV